MNIKESFDFKVVKPETKPGIENYLNWEDARKYARAQGMRLPTRLESFIILKHRKELDFMLPDIWWTSEWADLKAYYKDSNGIDGRTYVGGTAWEFTGEGAVYKQNIQVEYSEIILVKDN